MGLPSVLYRMLKFPNLLFILPTLEEGKNRADGITYGMHDAENNPSNTSAHLGR